MKKLLSYIFIFTLLSLLYIHQQVELVKLSYDLGLKETVFAQSLDHNSVLRYNVSRFKSPEVLRLALSSREENIALSGKNEFIYVARAQAPGAESPMGVPASRPNPFISLFTAATAEAKPVE